MCGIAGMVAGEIPAAAESIERAMARAILYRGRDAQGRWSDRHAVLLHSRLSVIDLATGDQPMTDASDRFVISYNGEIYNYVELRREYEKLGARFRTQSDTEVILEGYRLKGADVCSDLNGMFAFAIWDRAERVLFLARDRLGKKPLYWRSHRGVFYFASTIGALRAAAGGADAPAVDGMRQYAFFGFFPEGDTVYRDVHALPAASHASLRPGDAAPRIARYWRLRFDPAKSDRPFGELMDEYGELLGDAIRIRLRADVPLALTFSGGVDSGTIAALCAKALGSSPRCYTIDYHTTEDPSEETRNAERVARHLGLDWHYVHFEYRERLLAELDAAYAHYDQPCTQLALVYSARLYETIRPYAKVVLSGNGADELFTGYRGDERTRRLGLGLRFAGWLRPLLRPFAGVSPFLRMPVPDAFAARAIERARAGDYDAEAAVTAARRIAAEATECGAFSPMDFKLHLSLLYGAADSNYRLPDISGLAAQVEVRSPFLDHRVVEFASRVPDRYKAGALFDAGRVKYLPKRYYARHVPEEIAWSAKKGMGWNLRWGMSAATDPEFLAAFGRAYDALDAAGVPTRRFRAAWVNHQNHMKAYGPPSPHGDVMMTGFMLGRWLMLHHPDAARGAREGAA